MLAQAPVMRTESGHNQVSVESAMQLIEQMEKTLTPRQKPVQRMLRAPSFVAAASDRGMRCRWVPGGAKTFAGDSRSQEGVVGTED
jgi:hypothetical protein